MRREAFGGDQRVNVVRAERGYLAFVPPPLPPSIELDAELVRYLSIADRAVGELAGVGRSLPNPEILAAPIVRREAVLSSRIEGTRATMDDLALYEVDTPVAVGPDAPAASAALDARDVREVYNYLVAMRAMTAPDRRLPFSLPLLLEAHETLLTEVRGGYATPGEFRTSQNWIGPPGCLLDDATFVPPPPERLWETLDALEKHLHAEHHLPPLVTIGLLHYQFEAIHPFVDGNGRVGRLLIVLLLMEWGLLPAPLLDISGYFEPRRDEYYSRLLRVSTHGDWAGWLAYFLRGVAEQSVSAIGRAHRLQRLREDYRARVSTARASILLPRLVDTLFTTPAMTIPRAREFLGVSHRAARGVVQRLVDVGILTEVRPGRRRHFLAAEIISIASGLTPNAESPGRREALPDGP